MLFGLLLFIVFAIIIIAYYYDYKSNPKAFKEVFKKGSVEFSGKKILRLLLMFIFLYTVQSFGLNRVVEMVLPFIKDNNVAFNEERERLGIPLITENFEIMTEQSELFRTVWFDKTSKHGHFRKDIEYNILGVTTETDYFKSTSKEGVYYYSVYNFKSNSFEFFETGIFDDQKIKKTKFEQSVSN